MSSVVESNVANRPRVLEQLRQELVGPDPRGNELDCSTAVTFATKEESYGPWCEKGTGEEILQRDPPSKRYGIGVLYPLETVDQDDAGLGAQLVQSTADEPEVEIAAPSSDDTLTVEARKNLEEIEKRASGPSRELDADDLDLSSANTYRP